MQLKAKIVNNLTIAIEDQNGEIEGFEALGKDFEMDLFLFAALSCNKSTLIIVSWILNYSPEKAI